MTSTRRAAVLAAPRSFRVEEVGLRDPRAGEVRIAVHGCGVCGSNVPVWEGRPWFEYPLTPGAPGHEGWGVVETLGLPTGADVVSTLRVGDPVAFLAGDALADAVVVPARDVVALPPQLAGATFPGEALGCGFNVARRSGFTPGSTVAVVGAGFIGAVVTRIAAHAGARVVAVSRRAFAHDVARSMGAAATVTMGARRDTVSAVVEATGGELCDVVVEAVGAQETLDLAGELVREGGRLVVAGYHQDGARTVDMQLWNWRGIDVINAHERDPQVALGGIRAAILAITDGWFDPSPLYTHHLPLDDADEALQLMIDRPDGFVKALVIP